MIRNNIINKSTESIINCIIQLYLVYCCNSDFLFEWWSNIQNTGYVEKLLAGKIKLQYYEISSFVIKRVLIIFIIHNEENKRTNRLYNDAACIASTLCKGHSPILQQYYRYPIIMTSRIHDDAVKSKTHCTHYAIFIVFLKKNVLW